jgi:hypothetical protein
MDLKDLKKLARSLKLPGSSEFIAGDTSSSISWSKKGGFAGDKAIAKVVEAAKADGFVKSGHREGGTPDGSTIANGTVYSKGNITLNVSSSYGATQAYNRFSIRVTVTG